MSRISENDTGWNFSRDGIQNPQYDHIIVMNPWRKNRKIRTNRFGNWAIDEPEFVFNKQGDGHGATLGGVIISDELLRNENQTKSVQVMQEVRVQGVINVGPTRGWNWTTRFRRRHGWNEKKLESMKKWRRLVKIRDGVGSKNGLMPYYNEQDNNIVKERKQSIWWRMKKMYSIFRTKNTKGHIYRIYTWAKTKTVINN